MAKKILKGKVVSDKSNKTVVVDETFFTKKTLIDIIKEYQNGKKDVKSKELNKNLKRN